ncbi:MAG: UDP-2,3-diacylglucosamine diphosphatase [Pseudomonadota bacterium]
MSATAELAAPPEWQRIDILSDLHLQDDTPRTFDAFAAHVQHTPADAVLLLGDIFEAWVGDDACGRPSLERRAADLLTAAARHRWIGFMAGNRDFLVGSAFLAATGLHELADPAAITAFGQRLLFTHGDAWCLADTDYLAFRAQVRHPAWQQAFLSRPLAERRAIARSMREASMARANTMTAETWADVDDQLARRELAARHARHLVHGHTHRPAVHDLGNGHQRWVLSDWDLDHGTPRAEVLVWTADGLRRQAPCT